MNDVPKHMLEGTGNAPDCHNPLPDTNAIFNKVYTSRKITNGDAIEDPPATRE